MSVNAEAEHREGSHGGQSEDPRALFRRGFYYKTFMWPRKFWPKYEEVISNT